MLDFLKAEIGFNDSGVCCEKGIIELTSCIESSDSSPSPSGRGQFNHKHPHPPLGSFSPREK